MSGCLIKMMDLPQEHMGIVIVDHKMALQPTSSSTQ